MIPRVTLEPQRLLDYTGYMPQSLSHSSFVGRQQEMAQLTAALIVERHVSNILAKTGGANRTEAAKYASQHGLAS